MLDLLVASGEPEPPVRRLRSPAARPGLEALAGALAADQSVDLTAARTVLDAARAVVFAVLPSSGVLPRSRLLIASCLSVFDRFGVRHRCSVCGGCCSRQFYIYNCIWV